MNPLTPRVVAADAAYLCSMADAPEGFLVYVALESQRQFLNAVADDAAKIVLPDSASYLGDGDVLRLNAADHSYRALFRARSPHNSILLTERCNQYCLMCSQPPRDVQDDWILDDAEQLVSMLPTSTAGLGFTGGEPTIYGTRFLRLLRLTKSSLPYTAIHVLSNGRRFSDEAFCEGYASIGHPNLMVGIPLYSDDPARHDYVVQANGAFDETIKGILNLKRMGQRVEIRVVLHKQTIGRLRELANYIARNLLFVDQVALMGLEITGFTKGNLDKLWIDPYNYRAVLEDAVETLAAYRIPVMVFNHQLCVVNEPVRRYCVKSISDWKNEYLAECQSCALRADCGGFFSSAVRHRHSDYIRAQLPAN